MQILCTGRVGLPVTFCFLPSALFFMFFVELSVTQNVIFSVFSSQHFSCFLLKSSPPGRHIKGVRMILIPSSPVAQDFYRSGVVLDMIHKALRLYC